MILITLGTQDKEFTRILKKVDELIDKKVIKEEVVVQAGYTKYKSKNMKIFDYVPKKELENYIEEANFIITHAGVGTIFDCLKKNKKIIAVPRLSKFREHNNDHQLQIVEEFSKDGFIIPVYEMDELESAIKKLPKFKPNQYKSNNKNMIKCNSGSNYNTNLYNNVRTAGYKTRNGVVAAGLYLSSHIDVHIPYFWSGGHFHSYNGYSDKGDNFMGVPNKWGCQVKMAFGGTESQKNGSPYPFGLDCSGFVAWAIFNGGYYTGDKNQEIYISTSSVPGSIGGIRVSNVSVRNAKGSIKPGDIAYKNGHVGLVVAVSNNGFTVAEERGYKYGLVITEHKYSKSTFTNIVLMDNFYNNYKKGTSLWNGFK